MALKAFITTHFTKIAIGIGIVFLLVATSVFAFTKTPLIKKITSETIVTHVIVTPSVTPSKQIGSNAPITLIPTSIPVPTSGQATASILTSTPTPTQVPQQQTQPATVSMQISEPDGTFNFSLPVGGNACDELTEAKNEGKIKSVSFSDSYMSTMHSLYVTEMNGYQNNWTFTVNGQGPAGCSLSSPKAGDNIVWKFS